MPNVNTYLPPHLWNRRDELPADLSLSGILRAGVEAELAKLDAKAKRSKRSAA